ncbi:drosulfakinins [Bactrocera tryoni]|uniref:drosulfakinins n=1 Tax=Bactrocera tryoni TaxID=59916 RepID=UPI001A973F08|nr:drosulfakinins [Bactrocera tryoni]
MAQILKKSSTAAGMVALALTFCIVINSAVGSNLDGIQSESHDINSNGNEATGGMPLESLIDGRRIFTNHRYLRSIYGYGPKMFQISRSKIPIELDLLVENEDRDRSKRFDDYGHMRFGKRGGEEQFDDYGHMRFGRST